MNPLNSVRGALIGGIVLALILSIAIQSTAFSELGLVVWIHIVAGVMWIGLLNYFNVVQIPGLAAAAADKGGPGGAGVTKYIAPRALLWFRWAAVLTWLTGIWYLVRANNFGNAVSLGHLGQEHYGLVIGIGGWLGTIMLFNVWVLIWPNQKKILGLVAASDEQKAKARKLASLVSRSNFVLSIPLLLCMGAANHPLPL
ncbi:MAG TPA: urate hydroxylase PuuD [Steroidobacteraceae bacterium]|nr:urate hydroxylase PuuD [Steroidobacteraceae bacterium]